MLLGAIFDRDYFCDEELAEINQRLTSALSLVAIHERKEIENYLIQPDVLDRCLAKRLDERCRRRGAPIPPVVATKDLLDEITAHLKADIQGDYVGKANEHYNRKRSGETSATITKRVNHWFEQRWQDAQRRLALVPGKTVLAKLNAEVQTRYQVSLNPGYIIAEMRADEVPRDLAQLLHNLDGFRKKPPPPETQSNDEEDV